MTELLEDSYIQRYRLWVRPDKRSAQVTFPYAVLEREARKRKLTLEEFLEQFEAVAHYNTIEGVLYTFERIKGTKDGED